MRLLCLCLLSISSFAQVVKLQSAGGASAVVSGNGTVRQMSSFGTTVSQGSSQANQSGLLFGVLDFRPALQATGVTLANPTPNSIQISWTNGNGARRVVLARLGTAVTAAPQAATFYTADTAFGNGTLLNTDHYVVYEGTGNTITMTNLTPSTRYHVKVFEYNGKYGNNNANIEYQTGDGTGNPASRITLALPPTLAATNLTFTNVTKSSQTVNWQNGNGTQRLVVARKEIAPTALPNNGEIYTSNPAFGARALSVDQFIVYNGAGNQVAVTGLEPNTAYQYRVVEYAGAGEDNHYLTTTTLLGSQLTLTDEPAANEETAVSQTSFRASWNAVPGAIAYYFDVSDNVAFNSFVVSYENRKIATGLLADVIGLESGTSYYYRVRAENAAGASANSNTIEVLTLPATPVMAASTGIETSAFVANWSASKSALDYRLDVATNSSFTAFVDGFADREVAGTTQFVSGLTPGTVYHVRVRARNATGFSPNPSTALQQFTLPQAPFALDPTNELSRSFKAQWTTVPGASTYELNVVNDVTGVTSYRKELNHPTSEDIADGLSPSTKYRFFVRARNAGGFSAPSNTKIVITRTDGGGVVNPPQVSVNTAQSSITSAAAQLTGGEVPLQLTFKYRAVTGKPFISLPTVTLPTTNSSRTQAIDPAWLDELGLEYYFVVRDEANRKDSSAVAFAYKTVNAANIPPLEFAFNGDRKGYQIFSIPAELSDKTITSILRPLRTQFNGYDKTKWRLFHYPGGVDQPYLEYETDLFNFDPGKGYWLNAVERLNPVPISGSVIKANQSAPFTIDLARGWNQIGNPYPFNIDWTVVRSDKSNDAIGLNSLWVPGGESYQKSNVLATWRGAFVFSDNGGKLSFPVTSRTLASGRTESKESPGNLDDRLWSLPILLEHNGIRQQAGVGMHPDARVSKDRFDEIALPRFFEFVELTAHHPEFFAPRFAVDVVPPANRYEWTFSWASSESDGPGTLSWDNQPLAQTQASLLLLDQHAGAWLDMKTSNRYTFSPTQNTKLTIVYQRDGEWQPGVTLLGAAYPNPFEATVTLPVLTERFDQVIEIQIFDLTGREVRIVRNQFARPGPHTLVWDGTDSAGNPVSAGPLFYRIKNGAMSVPAKRMIRK